MPETLFSIEWPDAHHPDGSRLDVRPLGHALWNHGLWIGIEDGKLRMRPISSRMEPSPNYFFDLPTDPDTLLKLAAGIVEVARKVCR